jgi:hypothetical protein
MKASKKSKRGAKKEKTSTITMVVPLFPTFGFFAVPQMGRQTTEKSSL